MPKSDLARKMTGLTRHGAFSGTHGQNKLHHLWTEGQATQELFKDVVRSCRKKSSEAKVQ